MCERNSSVLGRSSVRLLAPTTRHAKRHCYSIYPGVDVGSSGCQCATTATQCHTRRSESAVRISVPCKRLRDWTGISSDGGRRRKDAGGRYRWMDGWTCGRMDGWPRDVRTAELRKRKTKGETNGGFFQRG
ncbi:uncharacterized protein LOC122252920 [Penaeus japonicus]|uniref:uncharacterized protein LOC122252920 n=1 Tax=Penaeus japonicus TaxID=27405 RepID=UPI001C71589D|nr:uncharacterized protein LOC122252920 [Penaeus japonicus]